MTRDPDEETRFFIELGTICYNLHCLPGPGGVLEQDAYLMQGVGYAVEAFIERQNKDQPKVKS